MLQLKSTMTHLNGPTIQCGIGGTWSRNQATRWNNEIQTNDVLRAVAAIQHLPSPTPPDSPFLRALGTTAALKAPPQTDTLAQRALEEWERTVCENRKDPKTKNETVPFTFRRLEGGLEGEGFEGGLKGA